WHPRDLLAVECVDHQHGEWRIGLFQHGIAHANAIERMKDIRPELDAIADSAEGRRAFEHAYRLPLPRKRERGGQPAKPATDDEDRVLQDQTALVEVHRHLVVPTFVMPGLDTANRVYPICGA